MSTISAKWMKAQNITSSFSKRENIRRNPCNRRNRRSTSFRRLYISLSYFHGLRRLLLGGTTGTRSRSNTICRVSFPSWALSINTLQTPCGRSSPQLASSLRPSGPSLAWPGEREKSSAIRALAGIKWILVVQPPRDFPMDCPPFFLTHLFHLDGP